MISSLCDSGDGDCARSGRKNSRPGKSTDLSKKVVSITCYLYFLITGTLGFALCLIVRLLTGGFDHEARLVHNIARAFALHYMQVPPGWNLQVQGLEKVQKNSAYVIVSNHQSSLDPFFLYLIPGMFKWTSKDWVFNVPVVGWLLSLTGSIRISTGKPEQFLWQCKYWLKEREVSVLIFPEGTRSEDGRLLRFKNGAFHLSAVDDMPILPVVLIGSRDILPKGTWVLNYRGTVTIKILDPIQPSSAGYDDKALRRLVRNAMQKELSVIEDAIEPALAA